jgi:apolipoprotein N-acyltransferase
VKSLTERYSGLFVLFAGILAVAAFAPFGWFPVAILSLAILFNQWLQDTPRQAFRNGLLFGLGFFGAGMSWIFVSVHEYGHIHTVAAVPITLLLVIVLSLYPAVMGYFLGRVFPVSSWSVLVVGLPAGWVIAEWLRGWTFTGLPWLNMGSAQIDSPLSGYIPVLGAYGTGWIAALSAALLLAVFRAQRRLISLCCLLALWAGGVLLDRTEWVEPRGDALQVLLVQGNISQEEKWEPGNLMNTFSLYSSLTFAEPDSDLIVWPETAIPAFYDQVEGSFIPYLETELQKTGATLLTGIPVLDKSKWEYFNSILSVGGEQAFYNKQHLVAFGEYLPLRWLIGNTLDALAVPNADFTSGADAQPLLQAAGYPVGASICFEVVFGEQIIKALPEAALLVNVSNDAWFGDSLAPHQHLEMARMRAKETGRPMLRATNTGISAIIDHSGRIIEQSPQFEKAVVKGKAVPMQGATPYVMIGNTPVVVASVICLLLCGWVGHNRRTRLGSD